jgi:hypothetical protein
MVAGSFESGAAGQAGIASCGCSLRSLRRAMDASPDIITGANREAGIKP